MHRCAGYAKKSSALPFAVHTLRSEDQIGTYHQKIDECLCDNPHSPNQGAEYNWCTLKSCILSAAESAVGRGRKKQPDWFLEAADTLTPLLDAKRAAHNRVLQVNSIANRQEFRKHQRFVKCVVDAAKEKWILKVATDAEKARRDGRQRWTSIRQLQMTYAGRKPTRPTALLKYSGEMTKNPEEVRQYMRYGRRG